MPEDKTISQSLMNQYGVVPSNLPKPKRKIILNHNLNLENLKMSIDNSMQKFGRHPWQTADGSKMIYSGFSLTYNPNHQDQLDPNASSLGTPKNKRGEFFYGAIKNHQNIIFIYLYTKIIVTIFLKRDINYCCINVFFFQKQLN